ncbi:hypothetical protein DFH09DRAFT_960550 [Mycena vulgaris]|nr:hypothetical protein DFH09DRAFT_960550 [Mycena vulgaris]
MSFRRGPSWRKRAQLLWWICSVRCAFLSIHQSYNFTACRDSQIEIIRGDAYVSAAFVRQGLMPISPYFPSVAISIRTLEVYRVAHLRCPRLGIQAWVRALCDMHGVPPRTHLGTQFSIAFDLYLAILAVVEKRVQVALGRDAPNWRLKNACPCCMYKLEGEAELEIPMLLTIDGNNSLSRFLTRERDEWQEDSTLATGASREWIDEREAPGDYYLSREEVDRFAKEGLDDFMKGFEPGEEEGGGEGERDGCAERWQNMREEVTSRALGMYDERGIFPALCRHSFALVVVDMVKSGELAKYGFAVVNHLMRIFGKIGVGYDIGCKFLKMVQAHPGLTKLARDTGFRALVGAFHGAAHARRCQVYNLTTYVQGVGMEALENCESYFSKSNSLAPGTRHASRFHRQQAITTYMKHTDAFDTYANLSLLLCNKYRRALAVKKTLPALHEAMVRLGVQTRDVFETWLEEEKAFLATLSKEPIEETMEMEFYQKLVNLRDYEERLRDVLELEPPPMPAPTERDAYQRAAKETRAIETRRRHAIELVDKARELVQDLEVRLDTARWEPGSDKWEEVATMVGKRRYQRSLDDLEGLIVARLMELCKCNLAGTAYKMRKHIAKALQVRSKAIKASIERYNAAASSMIPPRIHVSWDEVVEYAFLADFDLLREGRHDIREEPWALPVGRVAMDQHFKLLRAEEEQIRLDIEIQRLVTHIADEEPFLAHHERRLREEGNDGLAYQVGRYRMERGRFNALHMQRLVKLSKENGFTASLTPGGEGEGEGEEDEDAAAEAFMNVLRIADGGTGAPAET